MRDTDELIVRVPVVAEIVEVQYPLVAIPVEVSDSAVAVVVLPRVQNIIETTAHRILSELNLIWGIKPTNILHQVSSFLKLPLVTSRKLILCYSASSAIPDFDRFQP